MFSVHPIVSLNFLFLLEFFTIEERIVSCRESGLLFEDSTEVVWVGESHCEGYLLDRHVILFQQLSGNGDADAAKPVLDIQTSLQLV